MINLPAASVGLVAQHHAGPLPITHRWGARVGQQIDINVLAAEQERVVPGFLDGLKSLLASGGLDRLNDLDTERFGSAPHGPFLFPADFHGSILAQAMLHGSQKDCPAPRPKH
jgi:hypothetical protein